MSNLSAKAHSFLEEAKIGHDAEIDSWFIMGSPVTLITIILSYLIFVLKLGPWIMKHRKPLELKRIMVVYNFVQVVLCIYIVARITTVPDPFSWMLSFGCKYVPGTKDHRELEIKVWTGTWLYIIAKLLDLLDTVFFVLRKKDSHITFLHVYHHTVTASFSWILLKYIPGEEMVFPGFLNSAVHILMYTYYLIAAMGPKYRKFLWWKKYMTWIQLIQFAFIVVYMAYMFFFGCRSNKFTNYFFTANCIIFLHLFWDFYKKAYLRVERRPMGSMKATNGKPQKSKIAFLLEINSKMCKLKAN